MDNKQLIKNYYAAFNKQDWSTFFSLLTEDVVHEINHGDAEKGLGNFKNFMKVMDEHYSEQVQDLVVFEGDKPGRVAAEFRIDGKYLKGQPGLPPARGQHYNIPVGAFFEIKNGKVARVTNFYNLKNWIKLVE